jgi:Ca-activated chloride channel family protein
MVTKADLMHGVTGLVLQLLVVTAVAALVLVWQAVRLGSVSALWLTPDQAGRLAYQSREFSVAFDLFEDAGWSGIAAYRAGLYADAAQSFGRLPSAEGFFNRGNAFMKNRDYGKAITAFEQAVAEKPGWDAAQENLALAMYTLDYIERAREQSDTGDESELGADEFVFDNTKERGKAIEITRESTIELESAEKWMRSVDTETVEFLRSRFLLEASRSP